MATSAINEGARVWKEDFWFPTTGWWYIEHSVETVRTVGYTDYATALAAAGTAERGVVATVTRDAPNLYSVTIETDTEGQLTRYNPQPA
jgi:hypothetical protein